MNVPQNDMGRIKKDVEFNTERLLIGISHFSKTTSIVTGLNHSLKAYKPGDVVPLEIDGLPLIFLNENGKITSDSSEILQWIFKKGFEELIAGLTQSLIEAHRLVMLRSLALKSEMEHFTLEEMDRAIETINHTPLSKNFPALIEEIEKDLSIDLPYKEEIISCNKLRNCLVHRLGIVSETKDAIDDLENALVLKYRELKIHIRTPESILHLTKEVKKTTKVVNEFILEPDVIKKLIVPVGEEIKLTADIFCSVLYTSVNFIHELIHQMPISEEIKARLIPPYAVG